MCRVLKLAMLAAAAWLVLPTVAQTAKPQPPAANPAASVTKPAQSSKSATATSPRRQPGKRRIAKPAPAPAPLPVIQQPAPPPPTPEQMPPNPPQVNYENGQLTIVAPNSTLADILYAVRARTGAGVELPPGSGSERVVARLGPAPARDVIASLLSGSKFNYIILGTEQHPEAVQRIILITRTTAPAATASAATPFRPPVRQAPPPVAAEEGDEDTSDNTDENAPVETPAPPVQPQVVQPQPGQPQPGQPQPAQGQPGQVGTPQNPGQTPVKTPEQLLQELQRMQQQQQQQQTSPNQTPPPQTPPQTPPPEQS